MKNMKKKRTRILFIILILLILFIILFSYIAYLKDTRIIKFVKEEIPIAIKLDENQTDKQKEVINKKYNPDIVLPGWGEVTISANTRNINSSIDIYNPESNVYFNCPKCKGLLENLHCPYCDQTYEFKDVDQNVYYLKFTISLKENDEVIYSTDLIKPGYHIKDIVLNRELEVGDYKASILIEPYKSDRASKCNSGQVDIILHVTDTI